jgi:hypothetical protein
MLNLDKFCLSTNLEKHFYKASDFSNTKGISIGMI